MSSRCDRPSTSDVTARPDRAARERFYGRRLGRPLSARRKALLGTLLPQIAVPETGPLDPQALFGGRPVWLEIGFGAGEHLAALAQSRPEIGFIGCEPYINGTAALLDRIDRAGLRNIRVWMEDARPLLDRLPPGSIDRAYLLFPDPWPKTRHHGRRFLTQTNLDRLARVLTPGAILQTATDASELGQWMLQQATAHPRFSWTAERPQDWQDPPAGWVETRFQQKALASDRPVYLAFQRSAERATEQSSARPAYAPCVTREMRYS